MFSLKSFIYPLVFCKFDKSTKEKMNFFKNLTLFFLLTPVFIISGCSPKCQESDALPQSVYDFGKYQGGEIEYFKNSVTNIIDTLHVGRKNTYKAGMEKPCQNVVGGLSQYFALWGGYSNNSYQGNLNITRNMVITIGFSWGGSAAYSSFSTPQTVTLNNITYTDVYVTSMDPIAITTEEAPHLPWKIEYSKSAGFLRFYMKYGDVYAKL
jgi:hypothetical protein